MRGRRVATLKAIEGGMKGLPRMPDHVPASMADEWGVIARDLHKRKLLTESGLGVVATYLVALWCVREAQKAIEEHGVLVKGAHGALKPNPASGMLSRAQETVARLSAELGLTPLSRSRKGLQQPEEGTDDGAPAGLDL